MNLNQLMKQKYTELDSSSLEYEGQIRFQFDNDSDLWSYLVAGYKPNSIYTLKDGYKIDWTQNILTQYYEIPSDW